MISLPCGGRFQNSLVLKSFMEYVSSAMAVDTAIEARAEINADLFTIVFFVLLDHNDLSDILKLFFAKII